MMDRLVLCAEICKLVRISRRNPRRTLLSKREMTQVLHHLIAVNQRMIQLEAEVQHLHRQLGADDGDDGQEARV